MQTSHLKKEVSIYDYHNLNYCTQFLLLLAYKRFYCIHCSLHYRNCNQKMFFHPSSNILPCYILHLQIKHSLHLMEILTSLPCCIGLRRVFFLLLVFRRSYRGILSSCIRFRRHLVRIHPHTLYI